MEGSSSSSRSVTSGASNRVMRFVVEGSSSSSRSVTSGASNRVFTTSHGPKLKSSITVKIVQASIVKKPGITA